MPLFVPRNLYTGVNPHLNSLLQTPDSDDEPSHFLSFHAAFIGGILIYLNAHLPANYIALAEPSLQWEGEPEDAVDLPKAVQIRLIEVTKVGRAVACVELLSPPNKSGCSNYGDYRIKRFEYVRAGVSLIEIDLLHESPPLIAALPIYPQEEDAHPYTIIKTDPRPTRSLTRAYGFDVGQPLPSIEIPLADNDSVIADFDQVYTDVFVPFRFYRLVDYSELPERFETYSAADQQRIRARMNEIAQEYSETS